MVAATHKDMYWQKYQRRIVPALARRMRSFSAKLVS
jgi:hypothetical protein